MAKIVLTQPTSGYNLAAINDNFQKIQDEFQEKVLYRDNPVGEDNAINDTVDFNGNRLINLAAPGGPTEPLRLADLDLLTNPIGATTALLVSFTPAGGISSINVAGALSELDSEKAIKGANNDITSMTGLSNGGIPVAKVAGAAASGANNDITSLSALSSIPTIISDSIDAEIAAALDAGGVPAGTVINWPGTSAPSGYAACPFVATNVNRVGTYARVFANLGTTWGVGDGSTTFGIPYFPADYAAVQANANVGTTTVGENLAHTHNYGAAAAPHSASGANTNIRDGSTYSTTSSGGSANLAAGVRVMKCIRV